MVVKRFGTFILARAVVGYSKDPAKVDNGFIFRCEIIQTRTWSWLNFSSYFENLWQPFSSQIPEVSLHHLWAILSTPNHLRGLGARHVWDHYSIDPSSIIRGTWVQNNWLNPSNPRKVGTWWSLDCGVGFWIFTENLYCRWWYGTISVRIGRNGYLKVWGCHDHPCMAPNPPVFHKIELSTKLDDSLGKIVTT